MNTLACAALIPTVVALIAGVVHRRDRTDQDSAGRVAAGPGAAGYGSHGSSLTTSPGATRGSWSPPSRGEPSARAGSLSFPRVTDGPGLKRVL